MPREPGDPVFERRLQLARLSKAAKTHVVEEPPLLANLGDRTYAVTTASDQAQTYFDQGLSLTYAFNHPEALRVFRHARGLDPGCATTIRTMCTSCWSRHAWRATQKPRLPQPRSCRK